MEKELIQPLKFFKTGEDAAAKFLRKHKHRILERNYRAPGGEIDIIAREKNTIVFVEVRTRCSDRYAKPWETVGFRKRNNLRSAAKMYIRERSPRDCEYRFDVLSIVMDDSLKPQIEWIQNAF